jgi:hypothetical protein
MATNFGQKSNMDAKLLAGSPMLSSGEWQPKNILDAVAEIQQFHVIESKGQDIPVEFLTLTGTLSFFSIGARSGFGETFFLFVLFPLFQFYLLPFELRVNGVARLVLGAAPFFLLIANTVMCFFVSRFYIGTLTRRAINSLFLGRAIVLTGKSVLVYVLYFVLSHPTILTPERVWGIANRLRPELADKIFYGFELKVLPLMMTAATTCSLFILAAAALPYGSAYALDKWRQKKQAENQARVAGQN